MNIWQTAQTGERDWWGNCANTFGEQEKQLTYAAKMGLKFHHNTKSPYNIDMKGASVLDIGGGPCSLLLKCVNAYRSTVADPCDYPKWVGDRYKCAGITYERIAGEDLVDHGYDEVWIYNVLQHTDRPDQVVGNALAAGKIVRVFEWINTLTNAEHPHSLTEDKLNEWLGGMGQIDVLRARTLMGQCYYGVFKGRSFE